jgi:hypothetical protein
MQAAGCAYDFPSELDRRFFAAPDPSPGLLRREDLGFRGFPGTLLLYGSEKLRTCTQFTEQGTRA